VFRFFTGSALNRLIDPLLFLSDDVLLYTDPLTTENMDALPDETNDFLMAAYIDPLMSGNKTAQAKSKTGL
jgi:hypothetical protein